MNLAYVDANVILRFLTGDPPDMAEQAAHLFQAVEQGELRLIVDSIVLAETVWVLQSFYRYRPAEIAPVMREFLLQDGIEAEDKDVLLQALSLYESKNVDFADALVAARMRRQKVRDIFSFDEHFDRLPGVRRRVPGERMQMDSEGF